MTREALHLGPGLTGAMIDVENAVAATEKAADADSVTAHILQDELYEAFAAYVAEHGDGCLSVIAQRVLTTAVFVRARDR